MVANERDLREATSLSPPLRSRLSLSPSKLASVARGLQQLAGGMVSRDVVGEEVGRVLVGGGLELVRRRVPLGVVLVIFESRPDCLPQVRWRREVGEGGGGERERGEGSGGWGKVGKGGGGVGDGGVGEGSGAGWREVWEEGVAEGGGEWGRGVGQGGGKCGRRGVVEGGGECGRRGVG